MPPAARLTDMHTCPLATPGTPPVPHVGGPIASPGAPTVLIGALVAARMGDMCVCVGPPDSIALGEPTVFTNLQMAARQTDPTLHGGVITIGLPTVLIGTPGAGAITINGMAVTRNANGTVSVGNAITITGTPEFQAQVLGRLAMIANTPAGRSTLTTINNSGRTMNIVVFGGPNSFAGPANNTVASWRASHPAGVPVFFGNGNPVMSGGTQVTGTGGGTNTTVQLNPNLTLPNAAEPSGHPMPNDGVAWHELNHGAGYMTGNVNNNPTPGWTTNEERNTIQTGAPSEADYNRQSGYPYQRTGHNTTFVPNP